MSRRRREPRYAADLAVLLESGRGVARNVSASGIYFETAERLREGARIRFAVDFTPEAGGPLTVRCRGRVVRVEERQGLFGVAAQIDEVSLERAKGEGDARR